MLTPLQSSFDLSSLDGSNDFVVNGIHSGDNVGVSVSGAGDINGDGFDDLIIGAHRVSVMHAVALDVRGRLLVADVCGGGLHTYVTIAGQIAEE